jgi:hypothetical protein
MDAPRQKRSREPSFKLKWVRFPYDASANLAHALKYPLAYAGVGIKGSGKSALVELIGSKYSKVIDLYGSRDDEGLAWLRADGFKDKVLLLKGNSVTVDCNCADVKNATDLTLSDMYEYKAIISPAHLYSSIEEEWHSMPRIVSQLWNRTSWSEPWALLIREASSLIFSRVSLGESQQEAKNYLIHMMREMRHSGIAIVADTIRWMSVDIDFRAIADYTFIKAQGILGLPPDLRFIYRYFKPSGIMRCPVDKFIIVSVHGPIGYGASTCPPWHKKESENLLQLFDIRRQYGAVPFEGNLAKHVGDAEHVRIIRGRMEGIEDAKGELQKGMEAIGKILKRSSKTILIHINSHNNMIHAVGECERCARVSSPYAKKLTE